MSESPEKPATENTEKPRPRRVLNYSGAARSTVNVPASNHL